MIKTNKLRLGNWINGVNDTPKGKRYDIPMYVSVIGDNYIHATFEGNDADDWEYGEGEFEGIELTLDMCKSWLDNENCSSLFALTQSESGTLFLRYYGYWFPVTYVHELQNAYFFFTGRELKVKI